MKLFQTIKLKAILLSGEQLLLANSIVQFNMIFMRYPAPEQKTLASKIQRAKNAVKPGYYSMCFMCEAERKAMRAFILEYCCKLAEHVEKKQRAYEPLDNEMQSYVAATAIYSKFSA